MKKVVVSLLILIFTGCSIASTNNVKESKIEKEKNTYIEYVKKLKEVEESSTDLPFDINVKYDKLTDDEIRYQVIIDNPKGEIYNVKAVSIHNKQTDDVFPSTGIFEEPLNLIPNEKPEGIILVGYIPYTKSLKSFECEIKVIVKYKYENKNYTGYYVTKK